MITLSQQIASILEHTEPVLRLNPPPVTQPRVVVCAVRYHYIGTAVEVVLGHALRLHGARVDILLCDRWMPACDHRNIDNDTPDVCQACQAEAGATFAAAELPTHPLSRFFDPARYTELLTLVQAIPQSELLATTYRDIPVGQIAYASTLRHFLRGRLTGKDHWAKYREFLLTAMMMVEASQSLIAELRPQAMLISHGIYVTWGVLAECARRQGINVTIFGYGYRRNSLLISQGTTYHHDLLTEPVSQWRERQLTESECHEIKHYLKSRVNGGLDWISYAPDPIVDRQSLLETVRLDANKRTIGLFTNLSWDAAVLFRGAAFPDMFTWVLETIRWAIDHPDTQLVIRCHPAELRRRSETREKVQDVIRDTFPDLPGHIKIIPAESNLSTYTLSEIIDLALVYSSKIGLEFAARGLAVVVAGEAFYRGKGFTEDPEIPEDYFARLNQVRKQDRITAWKQEWCLQYAYHYFFRRHITLDYFGDHGIGQPITHFKLDSLQRLTPGQNDLLDQFCHSVLYGAPL